MLLVCTQNRILGVLVGIIVSAAVSAAVAILILKWQKKRFKISEKNTMAEIGSVEKTAPVVQSVLEGKVEKKMIQKIGFICSAGVGSSAMGAALFRKKLREMNLTEIEVEAYAADQIPEDLDAVVCQKDLMEMLLPELRAVKVYIVESLLNQSEYMAIIEEIQKGGERSI